jgi:hypothetical protein
LTGARPRWPSDTPRPSYSSNSQQEDGGRKSDKDSDRRRDFMDEDDEEPEEETQDSKTIRKKFSLPSSPFLNFLSSIS